MKEISHFEIYPAASVITMNNFMLDRLSSRAPAKRFTNSFMIFKTASGVHVPPLNGARLVYILNYSIAQIERKPRINGARRIVLRLLFR